MEQVNHIEEVMSTALRNIKNIADVNTVIGKPFTNYDGTTIIPISKVTVGVLTGGGEYGSKDLVKKSESYPFSGGSGAAVTMSPIGFLVQSKDGYKLLPVTATGTAMDKLFDAAGSLLEKMTKEKPKKS